MGIRTLKKTIMTGVAGAALLAVAAAGTVAWAANEDSDLYIEPDLKDLQRPPGVPEGPRDLFNLLDDNNDGEIDSGEWRSQKMFVFYARDANQNYMLTREEIPGIAEFGVQGGGHQPRRPDVGFRVQPGRVHPIPSGRRRRQPVGQLRRVPGLRGADRKGCRCSEHVGAYSSVIRALISHSRRAASLS